eukprot:CAMPEP_0206523782 /NCGR_PEP_ID=MMETSP0324_2-20121206/67825_1 /ASSEMBLY_ACC=CAM_ASM_000836 /TAXON_ID=2866 /ORGANISM="Crypthecodinium cohnii, Strain Seligo" /LENGTH=87 /DNA_ID=CAMNT_0054018287 /DNA_START=616 /DNA_END=880 /DNA_ORIENTATION=+
MKPSSLKARGPALAPTFPAPIDALPDVACPAPEDLATAAFAARCCQEKASPSGWAPGAALGRDLATELRGLASVESPVQTGASPSRP